MSRRVALNSRTPALYRDASLFLVAVEGEKTEAVYFGLVFDTVFRSPRARVRIIPTPPPGSEDHLPVMSLPVAARPGASSPDHVATRLLMAAEELRQSMGILPFDQMWIVVDSDRWEKQIREVARCARKDTYRLAVSNPSFEAWLLLHYTDTVDDVVGSGGPSAQVAACIERLRSLAGTYSKSSGLPPEGVSISTIGSAAERARLIDRSQGLPDWPNAFGSHVYKLIDAIVGVCGATLNVS